MGGLVDGAGRVGWCMGGAIGWVGGWLDEVRCGLVNGRVDEWMELGWMECDGFLRVGGWVGRFW